MLYGALGVILVLVGIGSVMVDNIDIFRVEI